MCSKDEHHAATQQHSHLLVTLSFYPKNSTKYKRMQKCNFTGNMQLVIPFLLYVLTGKLGTVSTDHQRETKSKAGQALSRLLRVSPGKNRTKRGMKWNRWHPETSLSKSGPGKKKRKKEKDLFLVQGEDNI